jgi:nitrous oxide reductase accessory protein NosL
MKKLAPFLITVVIMAIVAILFVSLANKEQMVTVYQNNQSQQPLALDLHHLQDPQCAMVVESNQYAAQLAAKTGKTWVFDDVGCMIEWQEDKPFADKPKIWVYTLDTHRWIDAKKAYYSTTESTPMRHGFGAHEKADDAYIDYDEMRLRVLRHEDMTNPIIRKKLLGI